MRQYRDTPQTNRPGALAPGGRATKQNDARVDIKMAKHTFDLAIEKLTGASPTLGKLERERLCAEIDADMDLAWRTLQGVMRRSLLR